MDGDTAFQFHPDVVEAAIGVSGEHLTWQVVKRKSRETLTHVLEPSLASEAAEYDQLHCLHVCNCAGCRWCACPRATVTAGAAKQPLLPPRLAAPGLQPFLLSRAASLCAGPRRLFTQPLCVAAALLLWPLLHSASTALCYSLVWALPPSRHPLVMQQRFGAGVNATFAGGFQDAPDAPGTLPLFLAMQLIPLGTVPAHNWLLAPLAPPWVRLGPLIDLSAWACGILLILIELLPRALGAYPVYGEAVPAAAGVALLLQVVGTARMWRQAVWPQPLEHHRDAFGMKVKREAAAQAATSGCAVLSTDMAPRGYCALQRRAAELTAALEGEDVRRATHPAFMNSGGTGVSLASPAPTPVARVQPAEAGSSAGSDELIHMLSRAASAASLRAASSQNLQQMRTATSSGSLPSTASFIRRIPTPRAESLQRPLARQAMRALQHTACTTMGTFALSLALRVYFTEASAALQIALQLVATALIVFLRRLLRVVLRRLNLAPVGGSSWACSRANLRAALTPSVDQFGASVRNATFLVEGVPVIELPDRAVPPAPPAALGCACGALQRDAGTAPPGELPACITSIGSEEVVRPFSEEADLGLGAPAPAATLQGAGAAAGQLSQILDDGDSDSESGSDGEGQQVPLRPPLARGTVLAAVAVAGPAVDALPKAPAPAAPGVSGEEGDTVLPLREAAQRGGLMVELALNTWANTGQERIPPFFITVVLELFMLCVLPEVRDAGVFLALLLFNAARLFALHLLPLLTTAVHDRWPLQAWVARAAGAHTWLLATLRRTALDAHDDARLRGAYYKLAVLAGHVQGRALGQVAARSTALAAAHTATACFTAGAAAPSAQVQPVGGAAAAWLVPELTPPRHAVMARLLTVGRLQDTVLHCLAVLAAHALFLVCLAVDALPQWSHRFRMTPFRDPGRVRFAAGTAIAQAVLLAALAAGALARSPHFSLREALGHAGALATSVRTVTCVAACMLLASSYTYGLFYRDPQREA